MDDKRMSDEVKYSYRTLLAYGKFTSGIGWVIVFLGVLSGVIGSVIALSEGGFMGIVAGVGSGIIIAILGLGMVISGQVISCFVSIERNTRATYEKLLSTGEPPSPQETTEKTTREVGTPRQAVLEQQHDRPSETAGLQFQCEQCGKNIITHHSKPGNRIQCPHCYKTNKVPENAQPGVLCPTPRKGIFHGSRIICQSA